MAKILQEVVHITKSLAFTQRELHNGLAVVANVIEKVQTDLREIKDEIEY